MTFPLGAYWDEDVAREQRDFFRSLDQETRELPDISTEREEWRPDNQPHGRLGRTNASTYIDGDT